MTSSLNIICTFDETNTGEQWSLIEHPTFPSCHWCLLCEIQLTPPYMKCLMCGDYYCLSCHKNCKTCMSMDCHIPDGLEHLPYHTRIKKKSKYYKKICKVLKKCKYEYPDE